MAVVTKQVSAPGSEGVENDISARQALFVTVNTVDRIMTCFAIVCPGCKV